MKGGTKVTSSIFGLGISCNVQLKKEKATPFWVKNLKFNLPCFMHSQFLPHFTSTYNCLIAIFTHNTFR